MTENDRTLPPNALQDQAEKGCDKMYKDFCARHPHHWVNKSQRGDFWRQVAITVALRTKFFELPAAPLPPPQARTPRMDGRVEGWLRDYSMFRPDKWDEIKAYLLEFENLGAESAPQEAGALSLSDAAKIGRKTWQEKYGDCSMCTAGDRPEWSPYAKCFIHRHDKLDRRCGNNQPAERGIPLEETKK